MVLVLLSFPQTAHRGIARDWSYWTIRGIVWGTIIVTVWSGVPYLHRALIALRESRRVGGPTP